MKVYVVLEGSEPLHVFATLEQAQSFAAGYELAASSAYECACDIAHVPYALEGACSIVHVPYGLGDESPASDEGSLDALLASVVGGE